MGQNEFEINLDDLTKLLLLAILFVIIGAVIFCLKYARNYFCDVEVETEIIEEIEIDPNAPSSFEVEEAELGTEETEIDIDQNAPPPDYDEIEFVSTAVPKQNVISMNSLPAYEDIYKGSLC